MTTLEKTITNLINDCVHEVEHTGTRHVGGGNGIMFGPCGAFEINDPGTEEEFTYTTHELNEKSITELTYHLRKSADAFKETYTRWEHTYVPRGGTGTDNEQSRKINKALTTALSDAISANEWKNLEHIPQFAKPENVRTLIEDNRGKPYIPSCALSDIARHLAQSTPNFSQLYDCVLNAKFDEIARIDLNTHFRALRAEVPRLLRQKLAQAPAIPTEYAAVEQRLSTYIAKHRNQRAPDAEYALLQKTARVLNDEYVAAIVIKSERQEDPFAFICGILGNVEPSETMPYPERVVPPHIYSTRDVPSNEDYCKKLRRMHVAGGIVGALVGAFLNPSPNPEPKILTGTLGLVIGAKLTEKLANCLYRERVVAENVDELNRHARQKYAVEQQQEYQRYEAAMATYLKDTLPQHPLYAMFTLGKREKRT